MTVFELSEANGLCCDFYGVPDTVASRAGDAAAKRYDRVVDDEAMGGVRFTSVAAWPCFICRIGALTVRHEDRN